MIVNKDVNKDCMYKILYYSDAVYECIENWPPKIAASYARITDRIIETGPNLGMPYTESFGEGLFEIRARGQEGIGRAFFCTLVGQKIVVLHAFIKKTQKTPKKDLELARKRMKEVKDNV